MPNAPRRAGPNRVLGALLALGTLLFAAGCSGGPPGPITREAYVDLYVQILRAADAAPDSIAARDSARRILAEHGVTNDDLMEFAQRYVDDPTALAGIWEEIEERLKQPRDTVIENEGSG